MFLDGFSLVRHREKQIRTYAVSGLTSTHQQHVETTVAALVWDADAWAKQKEEDAARAREEAEEVAKKAEKKRKREEYTIHFRRILAQYPSKSLESLVGMVEEFYGVTLSAVLVGRLQLLFGNGSNDDSDDDAGVGEDAEDENEDD